MGRRASVPRAAAIIIAPHTWIQRQRRLIRIKSESLTVRKRMRDYIRITLKKNIIHVLLNIVMTENDITHIVKMGGAELGVFPGDIRVKKQKRTDRIKATQHLP